MREDTFTRTEADAAAYEQLRGAAEWIGGMTAADCEPLATAEPVRGWLCVGCGVRHREGDPFDGCPGCGHVIGGGS